MPSWEVKSAGMTPLRCEGGFAHLTLEEAGGHRLRDALSATVNNYSMPLSCLNTSLCTQVMALRPRFTAAAQQAQSDSEQSQGAYDQDDVEAVKGMARLFAELGESYTALIATGDCKPCKPCKLCKPCKP